MQKPEIVKEFKMCPVCTSPETISKVLREGDEGLSSLMFIDQEVKPIIDPNKPTSALTTFTVPIINIYWDICADCGTRYCTRVEKGTGTAHRGPQQQPRMQTG